MLFTHFYVMQEMILETWFVPPANREYFGVEATIFFVNKLSKKTN